MIKHMIRDKKGGTKQVNLTARTAIIFHCQECMGFDSHEVRKCTCPLCALFPFRTHDAPKDTM